MEHETLIFKPNTDQSDVSNIPESHSLVLGMPVIIRTISMYYTGIIQQMSGTDIVLTKASWIADTGDWEQCLNNGSLSESVQYPYDVLVNRAMIVDVTYWPHPLPSPSS